MQKLMDLLRHHYRRPSVIGATFTALLVLSPLLMGGSPFLIFFSLGGLIIVVGGTVTVAFMSFDSQEVHKALRAIHAVFKEQKAPRSNLQDDVAAIIFCARLLMEKKDMRELESVIARSGIRDPFLKYGLNMVLGDYKPKEIRSMLVTASDACYENDSVPVDVLQAMVSHGPAFGMVGTLVGMVAMLCNLSDNITHIGPSLAVAFLSTLYGVLSARMIYMPAASKLRQEVDNRHFRNQLVTEGMVMLVAKKPPMYVQDRLNGFLRPEARDYFDVIRDIPQQNGPQQNGVQQAVSAQAVPPQAPALQMVAA